MDKIIFFCLVLLLIITINHFLLSRLENFNGWLTHTDYPWWNVQLGTTGNMSYDLRGDVPIGSGYLGPWNISSTTPIHNKPLWMVS